MTKAIASVGIATSSVRAAFVRLAVGLCIAPVVAGCGGTQREPSIRFEVRGLRVDESNGSSFSIFQHRGVVVAMGDSVATRQSYLVLLRIAKTAGGPPDDKTPKTFQATVVVHDGTGDIEIYGGTRNKKTSFQDADTWQPASYEVDVVGYIPFRSLRPNPTPTG